ncbi:hypothetical protein CERZMDRAFT_102225 [Cercospora zeae-maydis SCOH1-5]|uniref:Uncharacterized protein n=1 Tax=Cercospora zeae-maydis SCOH1-5 TaxID=717836 RepID=A0A6A6F2U3_9PEZI|nr:hypothetical protein CERZMDRAFT_102225 [Cercospora zeae-maydis SCOH1-5]
MYCDLRSSYFYIAGKTWAVFCIQPAKWTAPGRWLFSFSIVHLLFIQVGGNANVASSTNRSLNIRPSYIEMHYFHITALLAAIVCFRVHADFIIANTTSCYGAFPMNQCKTGVQVITQGTKFNTSFSCDRLWHAQDHSHVKKNSASPMSANFTSTGNVCDGETLFFSQNHTTHSVNGTFDIYKGKDDSGDRIVAWNVVLHCGIQMQHHSMWRGQLHDVFVLAVFLFLHNCFIIDRIPIHDGVFPDSVFLGHNHHDDFSLCPCLDKWIFNQNKNSVIDHRLGLTRMSFAHWR